MVKKRFSRIAKKGRSLAKKGRGLARKGKRVVSMAMKSQVARDLAKREMEIAADMLAKAAKKMKDRARKMR